MQTIYSFLVECGRLWWWAPWLFVLTKRSNHNPGTVQTFLLEWTDLIRAKETKKGVFSIVQFVTPEIALKKLLHREVTDHSSSVQQEVAMGDDENKVSGRRILICTRLKVMEVRTKPVYFLEEELRWAVSQEARPQGLAGWGWYWSSLGRDSNCRTHSQCHYCRVE